jgi:hypothetical protein
MHKILLCVALAVAAATGGSLMGSYLNQMQFEKTMGIAWVSFHAAKADCENATKEPCRLYGGFAPESAFADE